MLRWRGSALCLRPSEPAESVSRADVEAEADQIMKDLGMDSRGVPQFDYVFASTGAFGIEVPE